MESDSLANEVYRMMQDIQREVEYTRSITGMNDFAPQVLDAMRTVPRHKFVPEALRYCAYNNGPLSIGHGQTISQPYIVALMTDLLDPKTSDIMLEVGTGCGYQSSVLAQLVEHVYSVEIITELATATTQRLQELDVRNVTVKAGDGYYGWVEHAPYDGIVVTAAAPFIPEPLISQLKIGAKLVIPVGQPYMHQELLVVEKTGEDNTEVTNILGVAFVPLTGDHGKHK